MKIQPRLRKPRKKLKSSLVKELREAIERDAIRWDCSKSWIMATALAAFYGIDIIKPYENKKRRAA